MVDSRMPEDGSKKPASPADTSHTAGFETQYQPEQALAWSQDTVPENYGVVPYTPEQDHYSPYDEQTHYAQAPYGDPHAYIPTEMVAQHDAPAPALPIYKRPAVVLGVAAFFAVVAVTSLVTIVLTRTDGVSPAGTSDTTTTTIAPTTTSTTASTTTTTTTTTRAPTTTTQSPRVTSRPPVVTNPPVVTSNPALSSPVVTSPIVSSPVVTSSPPPTCPYGTSGTPPYCEEQVTYYCDDGTAVPNPDYCPAVDQQVPDDPVIEDPQDDPVIDDSDDEPWVESPGDPFITPEEEQPQSAVGRPPALS